MQINKPMLPQVSPSLKAQRQGLIVTDPEMFRADVEVAIHETLRCYVANRENGPFNSKSIKSQFISAFNKLREELLDIPDTYTALAEAKDSSRSKKSTLNPPRSVTPRKGRTRPINPSTLNIYICSPEGLKRRVLDIVPSRQAKYLAKNELLHDQMGLLGDWKQAQGLDLVSEGTTITQSQALAKIWTRERIETFVNEAVEEVLSRLTNAFKVGDVNGTTDRDAV
ncbi:MAG: hypothetical protein ACK551_01310 [Vampirovibrionales bacterium]